MLPLIIRTEVILPHNLCTTLNICTLILHQKINITFGFTTHKTHNIPFKQNKCTLEGNFICMINNVKLNYRIFTYNTN